MRKGPNASYVMNVQYWKALKHIGNTRVEADVVTRFLNLTHGATMQNTAMKRVEDQLGELICDIGKQEMKAALEEEVLAQLIEEGREEYFEKWKNGENIKRVFNSVVWYGLEQTKFRDKV